MRTRNFGIRAMLAMGCLALQIARCPSGWAQLQTPDAATTGTRALSQEENAKWQGLFARFGSYGRQTDPAVQQRILDEFLAVDQAAIPEEYRWAYYSTRLSWHHNNGEWEEMLKIRDSLMRPRNGPKDQIIDADILLYVAAFFSSDAFFPPRGFPLPADPLERADQISKYWHTHYRNEAETERIYQYIINSFDFNYVVSREVLPELAFTQDLQGEHAIALENYKTFEAAGVAGVFAVPAYEPGRNKMASAEDRLKDGKSHLASSLKALPKNMAISASGLVPAKAIVELDSIKQKYPDDAKLRAEIDASLLVAAAALQSEK